MKSWAESPDNPEICSIADVSAAVSTVKLTSSRSAKSVFYQRECDCSCPLAIYSDQNQSVYLLRLFERRTFFPPTL